MIAIEIKHSKLRAAVVSLKRKRFEVKEVHEIEIDPSAIFSLSDGSTESFKYAVEDLLKELSISMSSESYSITLNLDDIMTYQVDIPKVKDKEVPMAIGSALLKNQVVMLPDSTVAYSIIREKNPQNYSVIAQVLSMTFIDNVIKVFNELNLKLRYIDVATNTMMKILERSEYLNNERPLSLFIDVDVKSIRFYQFENNRLTLDYLEHVNFEDNDTYCNLIEDNVQEFIDNYVDYEFKDLDVILMGDTSIIKKIFKQYENLYNISTLADNLTQVENYAGQEINAYYTAVASLFRNDFLLSSHSKYDVNLLDKKKVKVQGDNSTRDKVLLGLIGAVAMGAVGYTSFLAISVNSYAKQNAEMEAFLARSEVKQQVQYYDKLLKQLNASNAIIESLEYTGDYLDNNFPDLNSDLFRILVGYVTPGSYVSDFAWDDGVMTVGYVSTNESQFMNYVARLKMNRSFEHVTYSGYVSGSGSEYSGMITAVVLPEVSVNEE